MHLATRLFAVCLLTARQSLAAGRLCPRQGPNDAAFTKVVSSVVTSYLPPSVYSCVTSAVVTAAPDARTRDPAAVLVEALIADPEPTWLSAVFFQHSAAIFYTGLASAVDHVRAAALSAGANPTPPPTPTPAAPPPLTTTDNVSAESSSASETTANTTAGVSTSSSEAGAAILPTGVANMAAAGMFGLVGLAAAL